tara:strand:+ start:8638 stop:9165 length:528 start_codon:yes stop_codon:yes gene_type:complete
MINDISNILKKESIFISLILILALSRLIPHPPNFTPIIAMAIMSNYFFRNIYSSIAVLFFSMLLSDIFIGFYKNMFFVYLSLFLIAIIFFKINRRFKVNYKNLFLYGLFGSILFYLISNFGVWALGSLYEKNLTGLINCYILAIPFFKNTLLSTIFFSYISLITGICINRFLLKI